MNRLFKVIVGAAFAFAAATAGGQVPQAAGLSQDVKPVAYTAAAATVNAATALPTRGGTPLSLERLQLAVFGANGAAWLSPQQLGVSTPSGPSPTTAWVLALGFLGLVILRRTRGPLV